jgi:hypothetical protein
MREISKAVDHVLDQLAECEQHARALTVERDGAQAQLSEALERERALRQANMAEVLTCQRGIDNLTKLNEDKFKHLQAYCKAASEDRARVRRLVGLVREAKDLPRINDDWFLRALAVITEAEEWDRSRS